MKSFLVLLLITCSQSATINISFRNLSGANQTETANDSSNSIPIEPVKTVNELILTHPLALEQAEDSNSLPSQSGAPKQKRCPSQNIVGNSPYFNTMPSLTLFRRDADADRTRCVKCRNSHICAVLGRCSICKSLCHGIVDDNNEVPQTDVAASADAVVGAAAPLLLAPRLGSLEPEPGRFYTVASFGPGSKMNLLARMLNIKTKDNIDQFIVLAKTRNVNKGTAPSGGQPLILDLSNSFVNGGSDDADEDGGNNNDNNKTVLYTLERMVKQPDLMAELAVALGAFLEEKRKQNVNSLNGDEIDEMLDKALTMINKSNNIVGKTAGNANLNKNSMTDEERCALDKAGAGDNKIEINNNAPAYEVIDNIPQDVYKESAYKPLITNPSVIQDSFDIEQVGGPSPTQETNEINNTIKAAPQHILDQKNEIDDNFEAKNQDHSLETLSIPDGKKPLLQSDNHQTEERRLEAVAPSEDDNVTAPLANQNPIRDDIIKLVKDSLNNPTEPSITERVKVNQPMQMIDPNDNGLKITMKSLQTVPKIVLDTAQDVMTMNNNDPITGDINIDQMNQIDDRISTNLEATPQLASEGYFDPNLQTSSTIEQKNAFPVDQNPNNSSQPLLAADTPNSTDPAHHFPYHMAVDYNPNFAAARNISEELSVKSETAPQEDSRTGNAQQSDALPADISDLFHTKIIVTEPPNLDGTNDEPKEIVAKTQAEPEDISNLFQPGVIMTSKPPTVNENDNEEKETVAQIGPAEPEDISNLFRIDPMITEPPPPISNNNGEQQETVLEARANQQGDEKGYRLGEIVPVKDSKQLSKMYFIGDGIKLPLQMVQQKDGTLQLSVDMDRICSNCKNKTCPKKTNSNNRSKNTMIADDNINDAGDQERMLGATITSSNVEREAVVPKVALPPAKLLPELQVRFADEINDQDNVQATLNTLELDSPPNSQNHHSDAISKRSARIETTIKNDTALQAQNNDEEKYDDLTEIREFYKMQKLELDLESKLEALNRNVQSFHDNRANMIDKGTHGLFKTSDTHNGIQRRVDLVNNMLSWMKNFATASNDRH